LALRIAERTVGSAAPPVLGDVLANAVTELQAALAELRELARGLHPNGLAEDGLAAALESLADRTPVPVALDLAAFDRRLAREIELSAYFVACEAVANAVKHANASSITIAGRRTSGTTSIEIADDGVGGADAGGSGLRGLADRVAALGGTLRVNSD